MSEDDRRTTGFWRTLPGVLTAIAGLVTALTGLVVAGGQIGVLGGDGSTPPSPAGGGSSPPPTASPSPAGGDREVPEVRVTADGIAGSWVGRATRAGSPFEIRLTVARGCGREERCGSISVSDVPCRGEVFFAEVHDGTYELSVDNFSPGSSASCRAGAGEYFTPQRNGTLRYRTGYDGSIAGTLAAAAG